MAMFAPLFTVPPMLGIEGVPFAYILCGIIWSLALGFAAGNFACSLVHRLPRGKSILEHKPYCGECHTPLATADLFPVFSALLLRHKCRYCDAPIPKSHFWTEILVGLLFCACYLRFHFSQEYLLIAGIGTFLIINAAIEANENKIMPSVLVTLAVLGMVLRTLIDSELYNFFFGGFFALMLGAVVWRKQIKPVNHVFSLPPHLYVVVVAGIIVGAKLLPLAAVLWAFYWLLCLGLGLIIKKKIPFTIPLALSVVKVLFIG